MNAFEGLNFETPEGARLKQMLLARIEELKSRNEDPTLSERETAVTRGGIRELKSLLGGSMPVVPLSTYSNPHNRDRG